MVSGLVHRSFAAALLVPPRGLYGLGPLMEEMTREMEEIKRVIAADSDAEEARSGASIQTPRG
jgi:hypothetical protein